ncbi:MAG: TetR/AcrR family transcriptional regulator [Deltaproteobacteria bacterium]|nr:TetR/AcrR family transcriptional regulator [Deltaproteobacteria bacterium]
MRQGEQTKYKIIQAALELFVRQGYHGTSINDITQKVRITKAAFYSHFESKGQLLLRIIDEYESRYIDQVIRVVTEHPGDAMGKLHRAISFNSDFAAKNPQLCLFLDYLTAELNADVDFLPSLKKVYDKYQSFITGIIAEGIQEGLLNKALNPALTALTFIAVHHGVLHQWSLNRYQLNGKEYVSNFRKILMNGLKA